MFRPCGRGHGDGALGLQIGRGEGQAQGVAEHPDRDDEHEELVGEHGAIELGAVEEVERAGGQEQGGDRDGHPEQPDGPERAVAQPPELVEAVRPCLAHPRGRARSLMLRATTLR